MLNSQETKIIFTGSVQRIAQALTTARANIYAVDVDT